MKKWPRFVSQLVFRSCCLVLKAYPHLNKFKSNVCNVMLLCNLQHASPPQIKVHILKVILKPGMISKCNNRRQKPVMLIDSWQPARELIPMPFAKAWIIIYRQGSYNLGTELPNFRQNGIKMKDRWTKKENALSKSFDLTVLYQNKILSFVSFHNVLWKITVFTISVSILFFFLIFCFLFVCHSHAISFKHSYNMLHKYRVNYDPLKHNSDEVFLLNISWTLLINKRLSISFFFQGNTANIEKYVSLPLL